MSKDFVDVYVARNTRIAHEVRAHLEAEGIVAEIINETLQSALGEVGIGPMVNPRILVNAADEERARAVCERYDAGPGPAGEPWTCANCGAEVDGNFDICWNCESPRP
ncbi:MAG: DUF2007 domain-containing protein [Planctomycetota bacterium]